MKIPFPVNWLIGPLLALVLTGCFESETALIGPDNAEFPFSVLVYTDADGKDITLTRTGDNYINAEEGEAAAVRLKALDANTYIGQIAVTENGRRAYQYALIRVAEDGKSFSIVHSVADEAAKAAAAKGEFGFRPCGDSTVCIETLDGFAKFATSIPDSGGKKSIFTIREMKLD